MKKLGVVILGLFTVACCFGQNLDPFDYHVADFRLLVSKKVQADMGITTAQVAQMNKFADKNRDNMNAYRQQLAKAGKDPDRIPNSDPVLQKEYLDLKRSICDILKPAQLKRLRELTLQSVGMAGMLDGAVAKRIGLSVDQLKKAQAAFQDGATKENKIREAAYQKAVAPYQSYKPKNQADAAATSKKVREAYDAELKKHDAEIRAVALQTKKALDSVVTKKQFEAYTALGGKKFTG
jgi:hypothetical protein